MNQIRKDQPCPNIILVEDNPDDGALTIRAFWDKGLDKHIVLLNDGEQALDFIINEKEIEGRHFTKDTAVILLDLHL
ncbi:MAG: hypothetical protein ACXVC7_16800, partial [Bacteroidia bacterium]